MRVLDIENINSCIDQSVAKRSLKKNIRPAPIVMTMQPEDWDNLDFLAIPTRSGQGGVLIIDIDNNVYATPYELSPLKSDKVTGRLKPVICDFCKTWQAGSRAATISFPTDRRSHNSIGFLCCTDLRCSLHVRDKTADSKTSRAQLREDITAEERIQRLRNKLKGLINRLQLQQIFN